SREVVSRFEATGLFRVVDASASLEAADRSLLGREATMVLHIPEGCGRDLVRGNVAPVQLILNAEQGAAAGVVASYASRILADFGADPRTVEAAGPRPGAEDCAGVARGPLVEIRALDRYNPGLRYSDYMVPGI